MSEIIQPTHKETAINLTELMMIFAVKFVKRFERHVKNKLSPLQFHTLFFLGFEGSQTMTQLCSAIGVSKQQMTPLVDKLIEMDLVTRTHNIKDRRKVTISVSKQGCAFIETVKSEGASIIELLLNNLPVEDVEVIKRASFDLSEILRKLPDYDEA
jgi:DNA-binding MarR family transcriptional regulator